MSFDNIRTVCTTLLYMISSVLFIRGIKLLGKADTARKGNLLSSVGMLIAVVTVLFEKEVTSTITFEPSKNAYIWVFAAIAPARCAAIPAKAMMTPNPSFLAFSDHALASAGVLCAE